MKAKIDPACKLLRLLTLPTSEKTRQSYQGAFIDYSKEWSLNWGQPNGAVPHPVVAKWTNPIPPCLKRLETGGRDHQGQTP